MKFRISTWLDTSNDDADEYPEKYGVQINTGSGRWLHCHEDGNPLIYDSAEDASKKIDELKARRDA